MKKNPNIRWRKKDKTTISNLTRKFNTKITKSLKKNPELKNFLPNKITTKELNNLIETRKDFNRIVKSYERFMNKDSLNLISNKEGLTITKWEKKETQYKINAINNKRRHKREIASKKISPEKGNMGTIKDNNLLDKKFNFENKDSKSWKKFLKSLEHEIMNNNDYNNMLLYKENYLKAIERNLGYSTKSKLFYNFIKKLSPEEMFENYYEDPVLQIQFISDPLDLDLIINSSVEKWGEISNSDITEILEAPNDDEKIYL